MKKVLFALLGLLLVTAAVTPATSARTGDGYTVYVTITGAEHLEEVFATLAIGGHGVSDRVSSQVLRKFDFHLVEGYSADFTFWGSKCRSCKIKKHFDASQKVRNFTVQLR